MFFINGIFLFSIANNNRDFSGIIWEIVYTYGAIGVSGKRGDFFFGIQVVGLGKSTLKL